MQSAIAANLQRAGGDNGVGQLVGAIQTETDRRIAAGRRPQDDRHAPAVEKRRLDVLAAGGQERRVALACLGRHDAVSLARQLADDDRHAGLDHAGLLKRDLRQRVPEMAFVIERDRGDGRDLWGEHVRRIEPAAESTSITPTVTSARRKISKAMAVVTSKKVGCASSVPLSSS